jgi:hypothetical protein
MIKNYAWLFAVLCFFTIGTFFCFSEPELFKASGGSVGLIVSLLSVLVISVQPIFGKLSGAIIFYSIGFYWYIDVIKNLSESRTMHNNTLKFVLAKKTAYTRRANARCLAKR